MSAQIRNRLALAERASHLLSRAQGVSIETDLQPYLEVVRAIRARALRDRSEEALRRLAGDLRRRAEGGETRDALLPPFYALVAEASERVLGLAPYDEQLIAAVALSRGRLVEMQTGEGKTLAAVLAAALNALTGRGVHVMTANDYLVRRDAEWMGPIYRLLGLRVGCIQESMGGAERRAAYASDVTYVTAREAGFDLLRDELRYSKEEIVHRDLHFALVDEADFLLIDEARVPLVIAGSSPQPEVDPRRIRAAVSELREGRHYGVDRGRRAVHLTLEGQLKVEELLNCGGMHEEGERQVYAAVSVALHAQELLERDVDYLVRDGRIHMVDELTGRVAAGRRWPYGIQPALEAKEGLAIQPEGMIYGSITIQHFATLYPRLAGMTATAVSAAPEAARFYGLGTLIVPPHRPVVRVDAPDLVFATEADKTAAVVEEVRAAHESGRPVLVGTTSVRDSEALAAELAAHSIPCEVLNARNDAAEAGVIARAGERGSVTISTNMAGRGTDIGLGEGVRELGGLCVIGTSRHESVRIDNQLRGRAGRQGDPGLSRFFVSLQDRLMERYAVAELIPQDLLRPGEGGLISDPRVGREIARAQRIVEGKNHELRRTLHRYSQIVEAERRLLQGLRARALREGALPDGLEESCRGHRERLAAELGESRSRDLLVRAYLGSLDRFWADHLLFVEEVKEGAPLQRYGGDDPLLHFMHHVADAFSEGLQGAEQGAAERFGRIETQAGGLVVGAEALDGPEESWTYLVSEDALPAFKISLVAASRAGLAAALAALLALPLVAAAPIVGLAALARAAVRRLGARIRNRPPVALGK